MRIHRVSFAWVAVAPIFLLSLGLVGAAVFEFAGLAAPVAPVEVILTQPNGVQFPAVPVGDEHQKLLEAKGLYTILQDEGSGYWVYASLNPQGELVPTSLRVGIDPPVGISPHIRPTRPEPRPKPPPGASSPSAPGKVVSQHAPRLGTQRLLVLLVSFTDQGPVGTSESDWDTAFFGSFPSAADYYNEISYGQLTLTPVAETSGIADNGIVGWLNVGYPHVNTGLCDDSTYIPPGYANALDCQRANAQLVADALVKADPFVDFAAFDDDGNGSISSEELFLYVVVAGYEGAFSGFPASCLPNVWGHKSSLGYWYDVDGDGNVDPGEVVSAPTLDGKRVGHYSDSGYAMSGEWHNRHPSPDSAHPSLPAECDASDPVGHAATLGIKVHEIGHLFALPDLYDTGCDGSAGSYGAGKWDVMAGGSWNWSGSFKGGWGTIGDRPAHLSAWGKWYKGWLTPTEVTSSLVAAPIPRVEDAPGPNHGVYQLESNPGSDAPIDWHFDGGSGGSGEYFLVENRQQVGYDVGLPGTGLLIWHIYEAVPGTNCVNADEGTSPPGNPRMVVLEQADGNYGLECFSGSYGDPTCNAGDSTDPWYSGNATTFSDTTTPDSKFYSGASSGTCVTKISASGSTMTADLGVNGCPTGTAAVFLVDNQGTVRSDRAYFCGLSGGGGDPPSGPCFNTGIAADLAERIDVTEPVEPGDVIEIDPHNPQRYRRAREPLSPRVVGVVATAPAITLANSPQEQEALIQHVLKVQILRQVGVRPLLVRERLASFSVPVVSVSALAATLDPPPLRQRLAGPPVIPGTLLRVLPRPSFGLEGLIVAERRREALLRMGGALPGRPFLALMGRVFVKVTAENGPIQPGDLLTTASKPGYAMRCSDLDACIGALVGKALEPLPAGEGLIEVLLLR